MTPTRRANLDRLLNPRHVALIGGRDVAVVAGECDRIGYRGALWPVNPHRAEIAGRACLRSVDALPEAPDAAFVAVPREAAIETVARLSAMGAGGAVVYTAGFGELGGDGATAEARLVAAAGEMALIGPNCYGAINYAERVALWPFAHGGAFPGAGVAIVTQSGMLSSDLTMSRRAVPFAYMVSAGNQAALGLEDFLAYFVDRAEVRAIGLHIEGLRDPAAFERAARAALEAGKPVVALKTGVSTIGAELAVSHTGSLAGGDALYDALFDRLGVIRVDDPAQLLETLKLLAVAGAPQGRRLAGFTCSGGGAAMLADHAERAGLAFPRPSAKATAALRERLPFTATVSNPLDYTTPIWGQPEKTQPVFEIALADGCDAAVIVQDYPAPGLDDSKQPYLNDAGAFIAATRGIAGRPPAAVCSTLPENIDPETGAHLVAQGVAPMQGVSECLTAIAAGAWWAERRRAASAAPLDPLWTGRAAPPDALGAVRDESEAKALLAAAGVPVPVGRVATGAAAPATAAAIGFPVALKMLSPRLPHKTEAGAVRLGLPNAAAVAEAVARMRADVVAHDPEAPRDRFLIEAMAPTPALELMIGVRRVAQFGVALTLASGGVLVELVEDATTTLLPAGRAEIDAAIDRLRSARLLDGYRGRPAIDRAPLHAALAGVIEVAAAQDALELEINPLFVWPDRVCAVDALLRLPEPA